MTLISDLACFSLTVLCSVVLLIPYSVDLDSHKLVFINIYILCPIGAEHFQSNLGGFFMRKAYELGWATVCNFG